MSKPYTIRVYVPTGNPDNLKIITKMNWTGIGLDIAREAWSEHKNLSELMEAGVYILTGYGEEDDLPTVYVGQGYGVRSRIDAHHSNKEFWDRVLVFVSSNGGLNRAHITWLEWALIKEAKDAGRCKLDNSASPGEPILTVSEKADTQEFLNEILSILPLVEMRVFEKGKKIEVAAMSAMTPTPKRAELTLVVETQEDSFNKVFLGENCWHAVRIHPGWRKEIKYVAAYQTAPVSAVTHIAEVASIEPYGDRGKFRINFTGPAKPVGPIAFANPNRRLLKTQRYASYNDLVAAKDLADVFKSPVNGDL